MSIVGQISPLVIYSWLNFLEKTTISFLGFIHMGNHDTLIFKELHLVITITNGASHDMDIKDHIESTHHGSNHI